MLPTISLVALCALAFVVITTVYNLFFHPLAKTPGPFLARISSLPSFYHALKGDRHIWIWQNFEIYGRKFRAGPNVVLFKSPEAYEAIYRPRANLMRSTFYQIFLRNKEDYSTLTTIEPKPHAEKRRLLSLAFTDRSIKAAGNFIIEHVDRWNELLSVGKEWSEPVDISDRLQHLVFDVLGDLCFGKNFQTKEPDRSNPLKIIPTVITKYMKFQYSMAESPLRALVLWLKPRGLNSLMTACAPKYVTNFYSFIESSVDERITQYDAIQKKLAKENPDANPVDDTEYREDMFHFLLTAKDPNTGKPAFTRKELIAESRLLVIAGSDTTATSLCSVFFYVSKNPRVYKKLAKEIRSTFSNADEITHGPKLASCKYLRAVIDESLRMTPAGPGEPERIVLPGGATIDGEYYPAGLTVGLPQWSYFHNDDIFGDANTYRPERWIESEDNPAEEIFRLKRMWSPFIKGAHGCIGQNLAILQMSLVIARTIWRFDFRIAPGTHAGEGREELGWGRRESRHYHVKDAFISLRDGPIMQFKEREF